MDEQDKSVNQAGAAPHVSGSRNTGRERPHLPESLVAVDNPDDFAYEGKTKADRSGKATARRVSHFSEVDNPDDLEEP